jgi:hypothetical protein
VKPGYSLAGDGEVSTLTPQVPTKCPLYQACPYRDGSCKAGYAGIGCQHCASGFIAFQQHCIACKVPLPVSVFALTLWVIIVVGIATIVTPLRVEELGVSRRQAWNGLHGGRFCDLSVVLFDALNLNVIGLQLAIPSQIPERMLVAILTIVGTALSPSLWLPSLCTITDAYLSLLIGFALVVPIAGVSTGLSVLLAPAVWKRSRNTRWSLLVRFLTSLRGLLWAFTPSLLWALSNASILPLFAALRCALLSIPTRACSRFPHFLLFLFPAAWPRLVLQSPVFSRAEDTQEARLIKFSLKCLCLMQSFGCGSYPRNLGRSGRSTNTALT